MATTSSWRQAIVVGASSGIGAAVARRLADGGTRVALVARRPAELEAVASAINEATGDPARALVFPHDVTAGAEVPSLLQRICHALAGLDLLVLQFPALVPQNERTPLHRLRPGSTSAPATSTT